MALDSEQAAKVQPSPTASKDSVDVAVEAAKDLRDMGLDNIAEDIEARILLGEKKYGRRLQSHNGRDAWLDAYQEALDCINYGRQVQVEGLDDGLLFDLSVDLAAYIKEQMELRNAQEEIHVDGFRERSATP